MEQLDNRKGYKEEKSAKVPDLCHCHLMAQWIQIAWPDRLFHRKLWIEEFEERVLDDPSERIESNYPSSPLILYEKEIRKPRPVQRGLHKQGIGDDTYDPGD